MAHLTVDDRPALTAAAKLKPLGTPLQPFTNELEESLAGLAL